MAHVDIAPPEGGGGISVAVLLAVIVAIGLIAFLVWVLALGGGDSAVRYPTVAPTAAVTPLPARR